MNDDINHPTLKAASVIAAGIAGFTWSQLAAILSCIYASILIGEWLWKRIFKPMALTHGWIKPKTIWIED